MKKVLSKIKSNEIEYDKKKDQKLKTKTQREKTVFYLQTKSDICYNKTTK